MNAVLWFVIVGVLLVVRLLQGVSAGITAPQLSASIQRMFTGHDRTRRIAQRVRRQIGHACH